MTELYLVHHGIKGQKWGVRRYQNPDGTRTAEGKKRASKDILKAVTIASLSLAAIGGLAVTSKYISNKKITEDQMKYILNNIQNQQSHLDMTNSIRNSYKYRHALESTYRSRVNSIDGDRKLFGDNSVVGRDALTEAKNFVNNSYFYKYHRGGIYN